jgi:hypothetical protein
MVIYEYNQYLSNVFTVLPFAIGVDLVKLNKSILKTIKFPEKLHSKIENYAKHEGINFSEAVRSLCERGLTEKIYEENLDLISHIVREQLDVVIKPHIERLAALSSKTGHMAATAAFLNIQAMQDLIPDDKKRDLIVIWEKARKKAVTYMKAKADDWEED